jgi:two-component system, sensor histidine kinase and response regulator
VILAGFERARICHREMEKEEVLGSLAHYLRNHLGGLLMTAQLMHDRAKKLDDAQLRRMAKNILDASTEVFAFSNQYLADAAASRENEFKIQAISLTDMAVSAVQRFADSAERKSIRFHEDFPVETTLVFADHNALDQVIDNLVSNAVKFSPPSKIIWLSISRESDGMMECRVRDEGPGCNKLDRANMFTRYHRLSAKPTAGEPSTGLGLNIAKRHMDQMHGTLHCESEFGYGATFVFRLPAAI